MNGIKNINWNPLSMVIDKIKKIKRIEVTKI